MASIRPVVRRFRPALRRWPSRWDTQVVGWFSTTRTATDPALPVERSNRQISERTLKLLQRKKVTTLDLGILKRKQKPITMVTAYDYPSAVHVDLAGIDVLLVGDSVAMVEMGHDTTIPCTVDNIIYHCQAVTRGAKRPLIICDMPFGSCEGDPYEALKNAQRMLKEGGADAVKIEGGKERCATIQMIVQGGIAVFGHVGLRPQHISVLGGFRAQGRTASQAAQILEDALAVQEAGAFAVVLECVPENVAGEITKRLKIPTIGIGAGPNTDGQVLVFHDLVGMLQHPHHAIHVPKFCKRYADVGNTIRNGLESFREDIENSRFPTQEFSPYKMSEEESLKFKALLESKYASTEKSETISNEISPPTQVY